MLAFAEKMVVEFDGCNGLGATRQERQRLRGVRNRQDVAVRAVIFGRADGCRGQFASRSDEANIPVVSLGDIPEDAAHLLPGGCMRRFKGDEDLLWLAHAGQYSTFLNGAQVIA